MIKFTKETPFSQVKRGQMFQYGIKVGDKWEGVSTYKKRDATSANPAFGQEWQVFGFKPNQIVLT